MESLPTQPQVLLTTLISDIKEYAYAIKANERELTSKLFGIQENEGLLVDSKQDSIEKQLYDIKEVLKLVSKRILETSNRIN